MPGKFLNNEVHHATVAFHGTSATLVAAVSGKQVVPVDISIVAAAAVTLYLKSSGGTALVGNATDPIALAANSGFHFGNDEFGVTATVAGESLQVVTSAAVSCAGYVTYAYVG